MEVPSTRRHGFGGCGRSGAFEVGVCKGIALDGAGAPAGEPVLSGSGS